MIRRCHLVLAAALALGTGACAPGDVQGPIPSSEIDTSRRRRRSEKPRAILATKRGFVLKLKSGKKAIFVRTTKGRDGIAPLYFFNDDAKVPDTLDFFEAGKEVVNGRFTSIFSEEFAWALLNSR